MKEIITWLKSSNHGKYVVGGFSLVLELMIPTVRCMLEQELLVHWSLKTSCGVASGIG